MTFGEVGENGEGLCAVGDCAAPVTKCRSEWYGEGPSLRIDYFCNGHAPADAEPIDG